ncbi:MAG TPA: FkbM family methyltransferase, partial [Pirellulales bacterium]|nr:FkbM family methyltransferase [Pirellulales bacterium]
MVRRIVEAAKRRYQRLVMRLFRHAFGRENLRPAYAQFGEDQVLAELVGTQTCGFYVDIGAHHPRRLSNTHLLYVRGWWGINVDPNRSAIDAFEAERPSDINLCCAVGTTNGTARLFAYDESALNTVCDARAAVVGPAASELLVPMRT